MRGFREDLAGELKEKPDTAWAGQEIFYYEEIDSTNVRARALAEEGCPHGTLVAADVQSRGRGRWGRTWHSPAGGVYMSLVLRPDFPPIKARMLTLIAALSAAEAIRECTGLDAGIKWPNDLLINEKKVSGILTEMAASAGHIGYVIVGFGINANTDAFPKGLKIKASSLKKEGGCQVDVCSLIAAVLKCFEKNYDIFTETLGMEKLQGKYNGLLINKGRTVKIPRDGGTYEEACAAGINRDGELIVRRADGTLEAVYAGEVLVCGIDSLPPGSEK